MNTFCIQKIVGILAVRHLPFGHGLLYAPPDTMPRIAPTIFRAYDIRGKAADQLTPEAAERISRAYGTDLRARYDRASVTLAVGRDARTHGPALEEAVVRGLIASGCLVERIGESPSPVNFFTICNRKLDGGIQVTASHNGPEDNGLKLSLRQAEAYAGEDIQHLRAMTETDEFATGSGKETTIDGVGAYISHISALFPNAAKGLKIAVDAGNGIAGPTNCAVLRACGADLVELYTTPDGTFPHHLADPSKHDTLKDLQEAVRSSQAHIGIAYDGDGDRLGIVDETGTIRTADEILLLLAKDHLTRHPGAPIIFTVSNSGILESEIKKWGGKPIMCKVGHSFVEHAMHEHASLLGGEQSGHFFCGENYFPYDDALVAGLHVLSILQSSGKPLSQLFADFPKVYQMPEQRPHCPDEEKTRIVMQATEHFAQRYPVNTLDGARVDFGDDAWAGIRQANTSPCLSLCIEARSPEKLAAVQKEVLEYFHTFPQITW